MHVSHQKQFVYLVKALLNGAERGLNYKPVKEGVISKILEELDRSDQLDYRQFAARVEEISDFKR
jgi:hypothetical protein